MAGYEVQFSRAAAKELDGLPLPVAERILEKIEQLTEEPRSPGIRKLRGWRNLWRLRVGEYRVIYEINDTDRVVDISAVRHRKDAYR